MKLLKQVVLDEVYGTAGHAPQLVDMTLQEIITAGKVTNPYQLLVLARVAGFFKNGLKSTSLHFENPVNFEDDSTSTEVKNTLTAMSDKEHVSLAQYLLSCIAAGECMLHNKDSSIAEWMRFVLRKQD